MSGPAQASARCWNEAAAAAAEIRDLQSRLMVAALQCQAMGIDVLEPYNAFVRSNRLTIQSANGVLRQQFSAAGSGQEEYDAFATALANAYGGETTNSATCAASAASAALAAEAAAAAGDVSQLVAISGRVGSRTELPGGRCPIVFAAVDAAR